jgi:hypothetical protein
LHQYSCPQGGNKAQPSIKDLLCWANRDIWPGCVGRH